MARIAIIQLKVALNPRTGDSEAGSGRTMHILGKRLLAPLAAFAAVSAASQTLAAEIRLAGTIEDSTVISVTGELVDADARTFDSIARGLPKAVVVFNSSGGKLLSGLSIGEAIRGRGFSTAVLDGASCTSSCALAWLAGRPRFMAPTGRVGFHAAFVVDKGVATEQGSANALVGAYLSRLDLNYLAVAQLTSASPKDITWLTFDNAKRLGIAVAPLEKRPQPKDGAPAAPAAQTPAQTALGAFLTAQAAAYGEIYSHPPASARPAAEARIDDDLKVFADGGVNTSCHLSCAFRWGSGRDHAARLYQAGDWKELARYVVRSMDAEDLTYFYLAAAAYNLKYYKAAEKYANVAYSYTKNSTYHCKGALFNECNGHVFPDEEIQVYVLTQAAQKAAASPHVQLSDIQQLSVGGYVACLARAARSLDDGKSDAASIALAIEPGCGAEAQSLRHAMEADWPDGAHDEFAPTFERENMKVVTGVVLAVRKGLAFP